jgi:hypothetical protein
MFFGATPFAALAAALGSIFRLCGDPAGFPVAFEGNAQ